MTKDVVIYFQNAQATGPDDEDRVEFTTDGQYSYDGQSASLSYMESEVTGLEGTRTSVTVMPDQVVIDREGLITSRMVFKERERSSFLYTTPYGSATLNINTQRLYHAVGEHGGHVEIDYVVDMEHAVVTRNRFQFKITEQNQMGEQFNV